MGEMIGQNISYYRVIEKLGFHLVRVLETKEGPGKVVTPSGKVGYVPDDLPLMLMPFVHLDPLCYLRDASGWKIAGFHRLPLDRASRQRPTK